jgi:phospholipase C
MSLRKSLLRATLCVSAGLLATASGVHAATVKTPGAVAPMGIANTTAKTDALTTATPIKHLVIIFDENVSFDHYFGTYPSATNPTGEPSFTAATGTPTVDSLVTPSYVPSVNPHVDLLTENPNYTNTANGTGAANPFRLDRTQAATADQNHGYTAEQEAYDDGSMDLFPEYTGNAGTGGSGAFDTTGLVTGYFDGNTVTAMWNYAQHYAMNDAAFTDTYGPSTPGALEAVSGQTNGAEKGVGSSGSLLLNSDGSYTLFGDSDPAGDTCSSTTTTVYMTGKNIGDLLNNARIPWGGFMGGFNLNLTNANGTTGCARSSLATAVGAYTADYVPHHNWFQYFSSTANPTHARPAGLIDIGYTYENNGDTDPANHEYDLQDFYNALSAGNYPAVSYIKMPAYQDAHAGYSDPLDEQTGVVTLINFIMKQTDWKNTAIIITYDDSDGWYDHEYAVPTSPSYASIDKLNGAAKCGTRTPTDKGISGESVNGRCGPGTRIPFLVISPYSNANYVAHNYISQASIVKFIEYNWLSGRVLGDGAFDVTAGSLLPMFNFTSTGGSTAALQLSPSTGNAD